MKLKRTKQCAKCPWRVDADPHDIPNGYTAEKHENLRGTICDPNDPVASLTGERRVMACHETADTHCIGWLHNQLGEGNNMGLRVAMFNCENLHKLEIVGEQHNNFDETLPK